MFCKIEWLRPWSRGAAAMALMAGLAACSGDSSRFNEGLFDSKPETTGSVHPQTAAQGSRVEGRPLQPAQAAGASGSTSLVAGASGVAGGGKGMASFTPAAARPASTPAPEATGGIAAQKP